MEKIEIWRLEHQAEREKFQKLLRKLKGEEDEEEMEMEEEKGGEVTSSGEVTAVLEETEFQELEATGREELVTKAEVQAKEMGVKEEVQAEICILNQKLLQLKEEVNRLEAQIASLQKESAAKELEKKMEEFDAAFKSKIIEMDTDLVRSNEKIRNLEQEMEENKREINALRLSAPTPHIILGTATPSEEELRTWKKNNIIIFGLPESQATDSKEETQMEVQLLFHDLGLQLNTVTDVQSMYRVGRPSAEKKRPIIIKLTSSDMKREILFKARNLKGNPRWKGVVITHDLTKLQCLEEKNHELKLRHEVQKNNSMLSEVEKQIKVWKVVGGRGRRHLALVLK